MDWIDLEKHKPKESDTVLIKYKDNKNYTYGGITGNDEEIYDISWLNLEEKFLTNDGWIDFSLVKFWKILE